MTIIINLYSFICVLLITSFVVCAPVEKDDNTKEGPDSSEGEESDENDMGTISPTEMELLKEKIIENQEENAEKFGLPFTNKPEDIEVYLKKEEEVYGKDLPEQVEETITDSGDFANLMRFAGLYDRIKSVASEDEDENFTPKSPEEMKKMKEDFYQLTNEQKDEFGIPEVSREDFEKIWKEKEEEYGDKFPRIIEKLLIAGQTLEKIEEKFDNATPIPETVPETTPEDEETEEESPKDVFTVKNAKEKICILAKFHSAITITYPGKSEEQTDTVSVPLDAHVKGKCAGPNRSPKLELSWEQFSFNLFFEKISEDNWGVSFVEFSYDTPEPLLEGAVNPGKVTGKSKEKILFETPIGKSYFCPGKEISLFSDDQLVAHVNLKDVHLQPYDVEDGKFSTSHRCDQVVSESLDEAPLVQDETIPLAVGCTLALITLLILVGFSVHRAYMAARVDYNNME